MMSRSRVRILFAAIVVAMAAGCASTKDLDALRSEVDSLKSQVQATDDKASRAMSEAQAAKSQSEMTDDKVDRMFQKSMLK